MTDGYGNGQTQGQYGEDDNFALNEGAYSDDMYEDNGYGDEGDSFGNDTPMYGQDESR